MLRGLQLLQRPCPLQPRTEVDAEDGELGMGGTTPIGSDVDLRAQRTDSSRGTEAQVYGPGRVGSPRSRAVGGPALLRG